MTGGVVSTTAAGAEDAAWPDVGVLPARVGPQTLSRARVHRLLDAGVQHRLTLLSAPPGAGKTIALLSWLESRPDRDRIAWVSLGEQDDNLPMFWRRIATAVARARSEPPPPPDAGEAALVALLFAALEKDEPLLLVLDDFHLIRNPDLLPPITRLLSVAPDRLRVMIASRSDPDVDLHLLRLHGELTEVRARQLAFTQEEAEGFFAAAGITLRAEQVETLVRRSEGWAAALRFAAISLAADPDAGTFIERFDDSERAVAEYLVHEVLARQDERTREFLLKTALCERVCGALADALTGARDGERTLADLERRNVFTTRDPHGPWYRYHGLFAELLRAEAAYALGDDVAVVHGDAARWLAANGYAVEALSHAVAGADAALAADLIGSLWAQISGERHLELASRLVERIPPEELRQSAGLSLFAAWERLACGDVVEAEGWIDIAAERAETLADDERRRYEFGLHVVRLVRARLDGDLDGIEAAAALLDAPDALVLPSHETERRRALVLCARGAVAAWRGALDDATLALEEAIELSRRLDADDCELDATSMLAYVCAVRGDLKHAARLAAVATSFADRNRRRWGASPHLPQAHAAAAICAFEWGDFETGVAEMEAARRVADVSGDRIGRAVATAVGAWSAGRVHAEGIDDIRARIGAVSNRNRGPDLPLLYAPLQVLRSRLEFAAGHLDEAAAAVAVSDDETHGEILVAAARVALARDDVEVASALLALVLDGSVPVVYAHARIEAAVLRSLAAARTGDESGARIWIEQALDLAEPEGIRGPFLEAAPGVAEPLRLAIRHGTAHRWLVAAILAVVDGRSNEAAALPHELLEPLSEREQVVLRYLPTLMSNPEIAAELFVSVNTVKTHLKSIYRKLGVSHRRDAVKRARELRLIS
jgi:LuxR family transcriptional regulator, maltose regulon positive regulatory protein